MRVLVTGAYGFLGSHITARLIADGHDVVGTGRDVTEGRRRRPDARWIALDFLKATRAADWLPHLAGVDAVVNCAGILQAEAGNSIRAVHVEAPRALFAACEKAGVRRFIQMSAVGADEARRSEFSKTKHEAEDALRASALAWVILRPSVVVGRAAYGGSALFRALAALPGFIPVLPESGRLRIVQVDDVAATVAFFLNEAAPARETIDLVGPQAQSMTEVLRAYRGWLGLPEARLWRVPHWLARAGYALGDFAGRLGWRPPVRSNAGYEIGFGADGDPARWTRLTGIAPRPLGTALASEPASVQEKWFARLYLLKPLIFATLALFWLGTGLLSLGPGYTIGESLMREGQIEGWLATLAIVGGGVSDIIVGLGIAVRRTSRWTLRASLVITLIYVALGTYLVPQLWIDPLGPMLKIWPVFVFTLVALAIHDDR